MIFVYLFRNITKNLCSIEIGSQGPTAFLEVTSWSVVIAQQKSHRIYLSGQGLWKQNTFPFHLYFNSNERR